MICTFLHRVIHSLSSNVLRFLQMQLFLTIFSLPILVAWGLPISLMSCIGNLVYGPFLTLFLLISSFVFFLELCNVPNSWLICFLELLTKAWSWCIAHGSSQWLFAIAKPSLGVLAGIMIANFIIIHFRKFLCSKISILCLAGFLFGAIIFLKKFSDNDAFRVKQIPCNNGVVTVIKTKNALTVIDPGVLGQRKADNWVEYTLIKELIQDFGTLSIDHLILTKPGILTFTYATQLCRLAKVSCVYLVLWHGENDPQFLRCYGQLYHELKKQKIPLVRTGSRPITVDLEDAMLTLNPLKETLSYKKSIFNAMHIALHDTRGMEYCAIYSQGYVSPVTI